MMNEYVKEIILDINCVEQGLIISAGQFDVGRKIKAHIFADGIEYDITECTAVFKGRKSDGKYFATDACVITDNCVVITLSEQMLASKGWVTAKVVLSDDTKTYSTSSFIIDVDNSLEGIITSVDDYVILNHLLQKMQQLDGSGILIDDALTDTGENAVRGKSIKVYIDKIAEPSGSVDMSNTKLVSGKTIKEFLSKYSFVTDNQYHILAYTNATKITENTFNLSESEKTSTLYIYLSSAVTEVISGAFNGFASNTLIQIDNNSENVNYSDTTLSPQYSQNSMFVLFALLASVTNKLDNAESVIQSRHIAAGAVGSAQIVGGAVISSKIGNGAVTADKISSNAVTTEKISDGNVTTDKLADESVSENKLKNLSVTSAKLGANSVVTSKIADNSITPAKIKSDYLVTDLSGFVENVMSGHLITAGAVYAAINTAISNIADGTEVSY